LSILPNTAYVPIGTNGPVSPGLTVLVPRKVRQAATAAITTRFTRTAYPTSSTSTSISTPSNTRRPLR
jgi:hypothetical protein